MSNIQLASTRLNEWHMASCDWAEGHLITLSNCIVTEIHYIVLVNLFVM
jgi:hypothetical protein